MCHRNILLHWPYNRSPEISSTFIFKQLGMFIVGLSLIFVMGSVTMVTLIANVLVVLIIYSHSRLHKKENVFVVSLAFSDLLMVPVMSLAMVEFIQQSWELNEWTCKVWLGLDNMCSYASIINICSISVVRYIRTCAPFRYHDVVTKRAVGLVIGLTWLFAAIVAYPLMTSGYRSSSSEGVECKSNMADQMIIVYCLGTFYLPCLLMIVIYSQLYSLSRHHLSNVRRLTLFSESRKNYKAAITIGFMIGVFVACWLPMFVFIPIRQYYQQWDLPWLYETCKWLAYINSMLDPILYSVMNKTFRETSKSSLKYYMTGLSS